MEVDKKVISELIKRQMAILGQDITLARVKNVLGIQVNQNGEVTSIDRDPQAILTELTDQFLELSGLIVKKTMESILAGGNQTQITQPQIPASPPTPTLSERQALTAHKELEELNKMLNAQ